MTLHKQIPSILADLKLSQLLQKSITDQSGGSDCLCLRCTSGPCQVTDCNCQQSYSTTQPDMWEVEIPAGIAIPSSCLVDNNGRSVCQYSHSVGHTGQFKLSQYYEDKTTWRGAVSREDSDYSDSQEIIKMINSGVHLRTGDTSTPEFFWIGLGNYTCLSGKLCSTYIQPRTSNSTRECLSVSLWRECRHYRESKQSG